MVRVTGPAQPPRRFTAYVVFQGSDKGSFWNFYTRPAWRHCWVMVPAYFPEPGLMAQRFTMKVEPLRWGIDVALWWEDPEVVAQSFYEKGATAILSVPVDIPSVPAFIPRGAFSCVTVVKAVLNVRRWTVWTPWQLFGYLVAHRGAQLLGMGPTDGKSNFVDLRRWGGPSSRA